MTHAQNGLHNGGILVGRRKRHGEGSIDLEDIEGVLLEVVERGIPHAEIIDGHLNADFSQGPQGFERPLRMSHQGILGNLQREGVGRNDVIPQRGDDLSG